MPRWSSRRMRRPLSTRSFGHGQSEQVRGATTPIRRFETLEPRHLLAVVPLAPIAVDDSYQVQEDQTLVGNVIAGTELGGADISAKPGLPLQVIEVDGLSTVGGTTLELASGATLEMAADGSFVYDPSTSPTLSAIPSGQSLADGFSYTVAPLFSDLYLLGDSLSDQGRLFEITGGLVPASPPNFEGRESNGPVWIEQLAPWLGIELLAENNYAVSGATTGDANFGESILGIDLPGVADQLNDFVADLDGGPTDPDALHVVWVGANDLFLIPPDAGPLDVEAAITQAITNLANTVGTLKAVGAEHIMVLGVPDLGLTPFATFNDLGAPLSALTEAFNGALEWTLNQLPFDVMLVDMLAMSRQVAADPTAFGFTEVVLPCFDGINICANPDDYLYWDIVHPTTAGHRLIADTVFAALTDRADVEIIVNDDTTPPELTVESYPIADAAVVGLELRLSATDASPADQAAAFTYQIDWGDDEPVEVVVGPASGVIVQREYDSGRYRQIEVTVVDQDGDASDPFRAAVVWGTDGDDRIAVTRFRRDEIRVRSADLVLAQFAADSVDRVVVFGLDGDDVIHAGGLWIPVEFDGGPGNDLLIGGRAENILRGGGGRDLLVGLPGDRRVELVQDDDSDHPGRGLGRGLKAQLIAGIVDAAKAKGRG